MNARLRQHAITSLVVAVLLAATGALRAQSRPGLTISNLRTGEVSWDRKNGLSIPVTVDFEISQGVVTNTIAFIEIEGSKGVGSVCGDGEKSLNAGTLSCTWTDRKFKAPKNKKMLQFTLMLVEPLGEASNALPGSITLPDQRSR